MKLETLNAAARDLEATIASNALEQTIAGNVAEILMLTILNKIEIQVPPLPLQWRIAGILSAYDELMEKSQRRIRILEAMARALYREWFVHFRFPGSRAAAGAKAGRSQKTPSLRLPPRRHPQRLGDENARPDC